MPSAAFHDELWRRFVWVWPSATIAAALATMVFLRLLTGEPPRASPPNLLQVQLVELPSGPASASQPPAIEPAPSESTPATVAPPEPVVEPPPPQSEPTEAKPLPIRVPSRSA